MTDLKKLAEVERHTGHIVAFDRRDYVLAEHFDSAISTATTLQQEVETLREQLRTYRAGGAEGARLIQARQEALEVAKRVVRKSLAEIDNGTPVSITESYVCDELDRAIQQHTGEVPVDNWERLVRECENLIGEQYRDSKGQVYIFFGLVHSDDDYYYGMWRAGELRLLSCVGSMETVGFELIAALEDGEKKP